MIPVTDKQFINTAMFLITSLSPTAKNNIELELYRQSADSDGSNDQHILESIFSDLIKDIQTIGLILDIDYSEVLEDQTSFFQFLTFVSYLLPSSLYTLIKHDSKIKNCVGHILDGSIGDDETVIQIYLSELGGLDGQDPLVNELVPTIEHYYSSITQTNTFTDYLRNLYQLIEGERFVVEVDPESHNVYRSTIRDIIVRFSDAVNLFSPSPLFGELLRLQDQMIRDIIAPINFTTYNYIFTLEPSALPDDLVESYHQKWYHYRVSHSWCSDYFKVRKITPEQVHIMAMYCFIYATVSDKDIYQTKIDELYQMYPSPLFKQTVGSLVEKVADHG